MDRGLMRLMKPMGPMGRMSVGRLIVNCQLSIVNCLILFLLASCRTAAVSTDSHSASRDTVYLARHRVDTLHTADTLRLLIKERGDTIWIARDRVRWRERTAARTDTLWRHRTDTVTRTERVEVEHPRRIRDWAAPMAAGAMAGFAAAALLLRRSRKAGE